MSIFRILFISLITSLGALAQTGTLDAGMYAIPVDPITNLGTAYLSWTTNGSTCTQLYVQISPSQNEVLVGQSNDKGQVSPTWIQKNVQYAFKLYDCSSGSKGVLLDQITVAGIAPLQKMIGVNKFNLLYQYYQYGIADNSPEANTVHKRLGQKSIHDAAQLGFNFMRVSVSFWAGKDIGIWKNQPDRYWAAVDEMLTDMTAKNVKIVPVLCWSVGQFSGFTGEPRTEEYANPNSAAQMLQRKFITEFVTRYKNNKAILFWELQNELSLFADLPSGGIKTEHILMWQKQVCNLIRSIDPFHMISSGNSDPRHAAWNLWKNGTWQEDTKEQMQEMMYTYNRWVDIASGHSYGDEKGRYGVSFRQFMVDMYQAVKSAHKLLYVGEFGEDFVRNPSNSYYTQVLDIINETGIEFASPWIWEFYQSDTYQEREYNVEPSYSHEIINKMQEVNVALGNPVIIPQSPDVTPPMSIISYPYSNHALSGNDTVWTKVSDNNKLIKQVNLNLDGKFYNRSTMFPFKNPVNTADLEECMHKFITSAHDMAGNIASDSIMLYKSYNRPPKPIITVLGVNKATITWQDNYINELAYVLQRKEGNGVWHDLLYLPKQVSTYTDSTLQPNTTYSYRTFAYYVGPKWYGPSVETSFTNVLTGLDYSEGETKISVFPNPANDVLNVQVNDLDLGKQLSLMNAVGIEVLNQKMDKNDFTVSLSNLNAGMYVLKVGEKVQKVIISK
jgi:hypothetical protein